MSTGSKAKHATPKRYMPSAEDDAAERIEALLREAEEAAKQAPATPPKEPGA